MATTPSVVQSVPKTSSSTTSALQLTGLTTTPGNLYAVCLGIRTTIDHVTSVTDSAGNTWVQQTAILGHGTASWAAIWTTNADSPLAITSVTVNLDSALAIAFRFFEIKDANNANPNIGRAGSGGSTSSISSTATAAPWPATSLALAVSMAASSTQDYTAAQAFTAGTPTVVPSTTTGDLSAVAGSETLVQSAYLQLNTTAAQTYTETLSAAHGWAAVILIIPAAVSPHVVQSVPSTNTAAQTTRTLSGLTTTQGNLYAVLVGASAGSAIVSSVTDSAGNPWAKQVQANQASNADAEIWTTTNPIPAAITSVTVNLSGAGSRFVFRFVEIAGANNTVPNGGSAGSSGTGTAVSTGATPTPGGSCLALATVDAQLANTPLFSTVPAFTSSATPLADYLPNANVSSTSDLSNGGAGAQADQQSAYLMNVTAAQSFSVTSTGSVNWAAVILLIQPGPTPAPPPAVTGTRRPGHGPFAFPRLLAPSFASGWPPYSAYAAAILADSPDLYWRMGDSGSLAADSATPGGHPGTLHGTVSKGIAGAPAGDLDPAMTFDASTGYIDSTYHPSGGALTLECWAKLQNNPTNHGFVMGWRDNNNQDFYVLQLSGTNTFECRWRPSGVAYTQTSGAVSSGVWHHLVFRFDGTNTLSFWVDGQQNGASWSDGSSGLLGTSGNFFVARDPLGSNFSGATIDEVAVYKSSLSNARILAHYNAGATAGSVYTATITEAVGAAADAVARAYAGSRTVSEAVSAADAVTRVAAYARLLSESASASDAVSRIAGYPRNPTESASASDAVSRAWAGARTVSEAVSASDAVARAAAYARLLAESASASDAVARVVAAARTVAEAVGPAADTVSNSHVQAITVTEAVGPAADAVARAFVGARLVSESASGSDAAARAYAGSRALTEALTTLDVVTRTITAPRSLTEAVGPADDSVLRVAGFPRTISEAPGPAADSVVRAVVLARTVAEAASASDLVTRLASYGRLLAESVGPAADTVDQVAVPHRLITEAVGPAADAVARQAIYARLLAEAVGPATDTVSALPVILASRTNVVVPFVFRDGTLAFVFRDGTLAFVFRS